MHPSPFSLLTLDGGVVLGEESDGGNGGALTEALQETQQRLPQDVDTKQHVEGYPLAGRRATLHVNHSALEVLAEDRW